MSEIFPVQAPAKLPHALQLLADRALAVQGIPEPEMVPSPCVSVCQMNPANGLCSGCLRTIDEIAAWSRSSPAAQRVVWKTIERRLSELHA